MEQAPRPNASPPLHSIYENDPDLRNLVVQFVDELDGQVQSIRSACISEDFATLRRISHQLKGAAGGYGFDPIGDCAARLEDDMLDDEIDIAGLSERVEDLITTCRAAVRPEGS
ncbi:MAG: Hpt domain-containing protein [Phycisphaerales bacterium]|nr:Hpt domain-containing protein [Phycisphaerales bacterium]MDG1979652.1 Hpt domain-containing protein [Phycisphaerales bacterium]